MSANPEREKLREKIAAANEAQRLLDEAQVASAKAQSRWAACAERAAQVAAELKEAEERSHSGDDGFIASLASDDVATLEKPPLVDELRARLEAAEAETAKWRQAMRRAEEAIEARRHALDMATGFVDFAARKVASAELRDDLGLQALRSHAEDLRAQLLDANARLLAVSNALELQDPQRAALEHFANDVGWLIDARLSGRPAAQPVKELFAALRKDAGTSLKAVSK
jgi:hypothetical protein